jgi:hypothetical protein
MIHDLTDLEKLLHQYDPEKILVGPLLNLWTNSSFRVFNIAGKGGKIHETIGLGFVELEIDAQGQRAAIVAALEGYFSDVQVFDSQLEMAQAAHTLWANDERHDFWQLFRGNRSHDQREKLVKNRIWPILIRSM